MTASSITKVMSLDSHSGAPSVPNPTPATEPVTSPCGSDPVDPPPEMDYNAVAKILAPIQESLNEAAMEAGYPSPPINTPEVGSPAPSVVYRYPITRGRGFSVIGDRLAQLKIDDRKIRLRDGDMSSSYYSPEPSVAEDEETGIASISEMLSDNSGNARSPVMNPRIAEYLSFTSDDLPANSVAPCLPSTLVNTSAASMRTVIDGSDRTSLKSDGVTEKSNWAEELEDAVDRACMRLEQLAEDEVKSDSSKTFEDYYIARLERLLGSSKRTVPVHIQRLKTACDQTK